MHFIYSSNDLSLLFFISSNISATNNNNAFTVSKSGISISVQDTDENSGNIQLDR